MVVADIGGTHARFALARIGEGGVLALEPPIVLRTADHSGFEQAWEVFGRSCGLDLPDELALAFAGPVDGPILELTNSSWVIDPRALRQRLGLARLTVINDFGAVAHAVATLPDRDFQRVCGPDAPLPAEGVISIVGPGTGLGAAALLRLRERYQVIETEGGHIDFAPLDTVEDRIVAELRRRFGRVSAERIASGRGLLNLYEALCAIERREPDLRDDSSLWAAALGGSDSLAGAALDRLVRALGSIAGDLALAHGATAVVIGGGLGARLRDRLRRPEFEGRFVAKGRFEARMRTIPVKLVTHPEPGLFGAAAAHAQLERSAVIEPR